MKFRGFAESLLGSKVKVKLIRHLITDETITSEREIASLIGVSHNAVNKTLKEFQELNLIGPVRVGGATVWQLNKKSYAYNDFLKETFLEGLGKSPFEKLKSMIAAYMKYLSRNSKIKKAVIFGSIAERRELSNSDIDLFILVGSQKDRENVSSVLLHYGTTFLEMFGNKLSPDIMTESEYSKSKNKKLLDEVKKGIIVFENED